MSDYTTDIAEMRLLGYEYWADMVENQQKEIEALDDQLDRYFSKCIEQGFRIAELEIKKALDE